MPNGASPRETSASAARTFSARATCFSTLAQTPSFSSALLPYLPGGHAVRDWPSRACPCPARRQGRSPGAILSDAWLARRRDQHERIAQQVDPRAGREQVALPDVVHPVEVGGNEEVGGRRGLDLLRERVARAVRRRPPCCPVAASNCLACSSSASLRLAAAKTVTSAATTDGDAAASDSARTTERNVALLQRMRIPQSADRA